MRTILVYEHITAMGWDRGPNPSPLGREGRAMVDAIVADFRRIPNINLIAAESSDIEQYLPHVDCALLIAPETDNCLLELAERASGVTLLSCHAVGVGWCTRKDRLAELWQTHHVPTPQTVKMQVARPLVPRRFPVVLKLVDGAGSGFRLCGDVAEFHAELQRLHGVNVESIVVQEYVPGLAASVSFVVNVASPARAIALLPGVQRFADDADHSYLGGELPLPSPLAERAIALGRRAIACVPGLHGHVGVDLVLGDAADGSNDVAIEINPRLTTSYVGLRQLAEFNLAEAILAMCTDTQVPPIRWRSERVSFESDGRVRVASGHT
jgi:tyramine---L-glutamate ligase